MDPGAPGGRGRAGLRGGAAAADDAEYEYEYARLESVGEEPALAVSVGREDEDVALDWRSEEQWEELRIWWSFAWPTMILFFSSQSYSFIDMSFVGHLRRDEDKFSSSDYLAAAAQAGMLFDITMAIFTRGFLQVLTVMCSQAFGAGKHNLVGHWLQLCLLVCAVTGIPVVILWWYSADVLDALFGLDPKLHGLVSDFARLSTLRLYPQLICASVRQFCMAQNIIKPLVAISILGIALNLGLNQVLIHGVPGWDGLGFQGSPLATATTSVFVLIVTLAYVFFWRSDTARCWPGWSARSFDAARLREFLKQGLPLTLATCLEDFQFQAISSFAIKMSHDQGNWIVGAHNGLTSFLMTSLSFQWGVMKSTSVRSAHYIGAGDTRRAKMVAKLAFVVSTAVSMVCATGLVLARSYIGYTFSSDIKVVHEVAKLILPLSFGYVALSIFYISMAMLDSQGRPHIVAGGFFVGAWLVAVPLAYVLGVVADMGLLGLWLGIIVGYGATTVYLCYAVYRTDWKSVISAAVARNALGGDDDPSVLAASPLFSRRLSTLSIVSADLNVFPSPVLT